MVLVSFFFGGGDEGGVLFSIFCYLFVWGFFLLPLVVRFKPLEILSFV